MNGRILVFSSIAACGLVLGSSAAAPEDGMAQERRDSLRIVALNLTARAEGRRAPEGAEAPRSRPGDLIEHQLVFTNTAEVEVRDVVLLDPIPQGLVYLVGSAGASQANVAVDFSIDGGGTYAAEPEVESQVHGWTVMIPAPAETYTHIRWTVQGVLAPGEGGPRGLQGQNRCQSC